MMIDKRLSAAPFGTFFVLVLASVACAEVKNTLPPQFQGVGIDQRRGERLPLEATFRNEAGQTVRLGEYFKGNKPVILTLVYYECPMLCTLVLNDTLRSLRIIPLSIGTDFDVLTVSFDPRETPELAAAKKKEYVRQYARAGAESGWHFLTGDEESIKQLTKAVGFRYTFDEKQQQYIHPGGIMIVTPDGRLARYFYGIAYLPKDLRLSLVEASNGKIGTLAEQVLLLCYRYDPHSGRYTFVVLNTLRVAAVLLILGLGTFLVTMFRRERRRKAEGSLG